MKRGLIMIVFLFCGLLAAPYFLLKPSIREATERPGITKVIPGDVSQGTPKAPPAITFPQIEKNFADEVRKRFPDAVIPPSGTLPQEEKPVATGGAKETPSTSVDWGTWLEGKTSQVKSLGNGLSIDSIPDWVWWVGAALLVLWLFGNSLTRGAAAFTETVSPILISLAKIAVLVIVAALAVPFLSDNLSSRIRSTDWSWLPWASPPIHTVTIGREPVTLNTSPATKSFTYIVIKGSAKPVGPRVPFSESKAGDRFNEAAEGMVTGMVATSDEAVIQYQLCPSTHRKPGWC